MLGERAARLQRAVVAGRDERRPRAAERQRLADDVELDATVLLLLEEAEGEARPVGRGGEGVLELVEQTAAQRPVHRPAVVGVDEAQVPQLGALVEVGDAGRRDLDQRLRQRVEGAEVGDARLERGEVVEEGLRARGIEQRLREGDDGLVVADIGIDPRRVRLGLVDRLQEVFAEPGEVDRPRAHQRLVDQVLGIGARHRAAVHHRALAAVEALPARDVAAPLLGDLGEHVDARAVILAPLGVVRGGGRERVG